MEKSIYKKAVELMNGEEIAHHESDLYLKKNEVSTNLLSSYQFRYNVRTFVSNIDRTVWFDIPFAYDPFWERKKC